jgi:glycosyltransferase involved in cell wall biosynthesis
MTKKLPITVSMISGAEAHRITKSLESVAGWASEIIIVLNEDVRDGTEEIALKFGAKVFREPWKGHVAQKNSASDKANQQWILGLDADEVVSPELGLEFATALAAEEKSPEHDAFSVPRISFYCGKWIRHGDWYPDRKTRLWRRGKGRWEGLDPHDRLEAVGKVGKLKAKLFHHTSETINHQVAKTVKYADAFAHNCERDKRAVSNLELLVRPPWRFIRGYVFKLGFLDGWQGFAIAWMTAFYTFLRYVRVREDETNKDLKSKK